MKQPNFVKAIFVPIFIGFATIIRNDRFCWK
jgi:hypothetical protein